MEQNTLQQLTIQTSVGKINILRSPVRQKNLILLHGLGASLQVWSKLISYINKDIGICAIDLLGHGASDKPKITYNIFNQIIMLDEVIKKIYPKTATISIMGNSYGAWVGAAYVSTLTSQEIYNTLILEDMAGFFGYFEDIAALNQNAVKTYTQNMFNNLIRINNNDEYVMRSILDNMQKDALSCNTLSKIHSSCLIIWGEKDIVIDKKYAMKISACIPKSIVKIISGAGHTPHYSHAQEISVIINDFVGKENENSYNIKK